MDIQEKKAFEIAFENKLGAHCCQFDLDEDGNYEDRETLCAWHMWQAAKAQSDKKIKLLLCDEHLQKCESPTGVFNSQYPDEEPCLICLAKEAKAQSVPEWISVDDRLPKENQFCVTYFEPTKSRIGALAGHYEFGFGLSSFGYRKATHWMPLPDAPQEPAK